VVKNQALQPRKQKDSQNEKEQTSKAQEKDLAAGKTATAKTKTTPYSSGRRVGQDEL